MTYLTKDFFAGNRKTLIEKSQAQLIIIAGNGLLQRSGSTNFEFQQDSNFYYLTGVDEPNMLLAINVKTGEEVLVRGPQTEIGEIFDGSETAQKLKSRSGIAQIESYENGWKILEAWITDLKIAHIVEPPAKFIDVYSMYTNPARAGLKRQIKRLGGEVKDIFPTLMDMRTIKQAPEIKTLQAAIDVSAQAFENLNSKIKDLNFEYEAEAEIISTFMQNKRSTPGYGTIVASGKNACTLHYMHGNDLINKQQVLLIDAGAQVEHYSSDITRVFLPDDTRAKEVFMAVSELQQKALEIIKPGVDFIDYEREMINHYGEKLQQLGLIKEPLEKSIRKYMPHATSHFLGLDVHDAGNYRQEFKPGMVITVEPGFYINQESIGIRLEDDILITADGHKMLSGKIPKELYLN